MFSKIKFFSIFLLFLNFVYLNAKPQNDGRIVGGSPQPIELRAFQAIVYPGNGLCGGSILSVDWVVTAAHCTYSKAAKDIYIATGCQDTRYYQDYYAVSVVIIHPEYDHNTKDNDISMLKTDSPITFGNTVESVSLETILPPDDARVTVSGYGNDGYDGQRTFKLMSAILYMYNFEKCKEKFGGNITTNMFCATVPDFDKDSCQGDSGGPITYRNKLVGVVSFGRKCAEKGFPGVYTSIPVFVSWINTVMGII